MRLQGKGYFICNLSECEAGNRNAVLAAAQAAGLSHVLVRIAEGVRRLEIDPSGEDMTAPLVRTLQAGGIAVWGWHRVCGDDPAGEASIAIQRVRELSLDGYIVDAGTEYEQSGKARAAGQFMAQVRTGLQVPIALRSYRFPYDHPELPWATFLQYCDYHMPQVYWEGAHDAGIQLRESKRQCDALPYARPYVATGPVFRSGDWAPTEDDMVDFLNTARASGIQAVNFYAWDDCRRGLPHLWETVAGFSWSSQPSRHASQPDAAVGIPDMAPDDISVRYIAALNSRQAEQVTALYASKALHVNSERAYHGTIAIQVSYSAFLAWLPGGVIHLDKVETQGDACYLSWSVGDYSSQSILVVRDGQIILDRIIPG